MKSEIRCVAQMRVGSRAAWCMPLVAVCLMLPACPALAQSVDYTSMEEIFGEPVTTSATGAPLRASLAPADIVILTQDDIRRFGVDYLPDLLRYVPGLDVHETASLGSSVSIRGYDAQSNPRLLVLVNGRPIFDEFEAGVNWNSLPVQLGEIRQIEIVKGPNSALFGFNAASGVINIVTYDPLYDSVNTATVATGTQGLAEAHAVVTYRRAGIGGVRVSLGGLRLNEFEAPQTEPATQVHPVNVEGNIEGRWLIRPGLEFTLEAAAVNQRQNQSDGAVAGFEVRTNAVHGELAAQTSIGRLSLVAYTNGAGVTPVGTGDYTYRVYDLQVADLLKIGAAHTVRLNVEVKDDSATSPHIIGGTGGYTDYAASLMWNWQILPTLVFNNAIRGDQLYLRYSGTRIPGTGVTPALINSVTDSGISFNSGLVWSVTDLDTVQASLARGLQLPSLIDLDFQAAFRGVFFVGNPKLLPTAVTNAELAYTRNLPHLSTDLHLAVFAQRNDDLAVQPFFAPFQFTPLGFFGRAATIGHSDEAGLELSLKGSLPHGLRWNAGYTYTSITDHLHPGLAPSEYSDYAHGTPRNILIFGLGATEGKWEIDIDGRWQSKFVDFMAVGPSHVPFEVGDFLTTSGRVAYRIFDPLTVAVSAQQLLRERIEESSGIPVERRVIVSLTAKL